MRIYPVLFAFFLSLLLAACDPNSGLKLHDGPGAYGLSGKTYRAVDTLVEQTAPKLPQNVPLLVGTISDINKIETTTPLGRTIAEQIGARLVQHGYTVSDVRLRNAVNIKSDSKNKGADGEYMLSRDIAVIKAEHDVGAIVTGTYVVAQNEVLVNLRIIEASSSHILGAIDYRLPLSDDVKQMVEDGAFFKPGPYARDWNF